MAVLVCGRSSLWPFRSVAVPVCGLFGLWPFRSVAVKFVSYRIVSHHIISYHIISYLIPCSVLILASDWLTTVRYGGVSHV